MIQVLLVEDDASIVKVIKDYFERREDFAVDVAENGLIGEDLFYERSYDLVLLDVMMPKKNGFELCKDIRRRSNVPIIFISSVSDNLNQVMAMNMGADDFIAKPFEMDLLMTKIKALLRRTYDLTVEDKVLTAKGAVLNTSDDTLEYEGKKIALSRNEYKIIYTLIENKGHIVSRAKLMEKLWEGDEFVDENALSVNINRLRKKLDSEGLTDFIVTRFKAGYMIGD